MTKGNSATDEVTVVVGQDCVVSDGGDRGPRFIRGDCNGDGELDVSDAVCILKWLALGEPVPGCLAAANVDGGGGADIADPIYVLAHLFLDGPAPLAPFPGCGPLESPPDDGLGCETPPERCEVANEG